MFLYMFLSIRKLKHSVRFISKHSLLAFQAFFTLSGVAREFIVNKENALVVNFRSAEQIFDAVCSILQDGELREKIIQNGKRAIEKNFSLPMFIEKLEKIYLS
jgi:hypothetical protein